VTDGHATPERPAGRARPWVAGRVHWRRLFVVWFVLTAIAEPLLYLVLGPHLPPGNMTDAAAGDQFDATVLTMVAVPVVIAVIEYYLYAIIVWRHRPGEALVDGPPITGHLGIQAGWIAITSAIVFGAFVFGTYELIVPAGAGGGEGPSPIWVPASKDILPVQVIGQQWEFTYRYPTFGGMETTQLVLPVNTPIAFHVTSLDVIHDWWAYQLGVKADANPQVDNVAFATAHQLGSVTVRCDELCGIWHGAMFNYGQVVSQSAFMSWGTSTEHKLASLTKTLPKFAWTYVPSANGSSGSYYPSEDPFVQAYNYEYGKSGPEGKLPAVRVTSPSGS
jgi:cytochrome c oxidase subunit 2